MPKFKPELNYIDKQGKRISKRFPTYVLLKRSLHDIFMNEIKHGDVVYVSRSRRGEWGEWFEHWEIIANKITKTKEGWQ